MNVQTATPATIDLATIKDRQHAAWGSGDYARIGTTLQVVGEMPLRGRRSPQQSARPRCRRQHGNATLAAARRFADVVSTDYVALAA